ncbi:hypothetical protein CJD36_015565 [Flavipsychrobacter stenotrophus]|uniref:Uncharacterized protein n=1 Tax=Flavipsychrobacter stenotrophus TaxID=2077091 RepID=A0A2S7ST66_9BACT|nr:hypothetical protein [Flavipsychrobacter stenotrophus]PQJ10113.1 hypothetical protein CJD36_015565 [Flavipsychrobacter stenotrophus]
MDDRKILYKDFLNNKDVYNLNVGYWRRKLEKSLEEKISFDNKNQIITNKNKHGKNFYDGNPIFSYINITKGKAIRIIQENPDDIQHYSDIKLIEGWFDNILLDIEVLELVISLYMTQDTVQKCINMVGAWLAGDLNDNNIDRYIE